MFRNLSQSPREFADPSESRKKESEGPILNLPKYGSRSLKFEDLVQCTLSTNKMDPTESRKDAKVTVKAKKLNDYYAGFNARIENVGLHLLKRSKWKLETNLLTQQAALRQHYIDRLRVRKYAYEEMICGAREKSRRKRVLHGISNDIDR